jgi:hypothetical protein
VYTDAHGNQIRGLLVAPRVAVEIGRPVPCVRSRDEFHNIKVQGADGQLKYDSCLSMQRDPVASGDFLTLELGPGWLVPGVEPTTSLRVPDFDVSFDWPGRAVRGNGPAGQHLDVVLGSAFRAFVRQSVQTDAQGQFSLPWAGDPAATATVHFDAGNAFTVEQTFGLQSILVGIRNVIVGGSGGTLTDPVEASLTLLDGTGEVKADQYFTLGSSGIAETPWSGQWPEPGDRGRGVSPLPGDQVEVQIGNGDVESLAVPSLTAEAGADNDIITGTAPPDSDLVITFAGASLSEARHSPVRTHVDGQGAFRVELKGLVDVQPGMWGLVATSATDVPVAFYTVWSAQRLSLDMNLGTVEGAGSLSETFRVQVHDAAGNLKFTSEDTTPGVVSFSDPFYSRLDWGAQLYDDVFSHLANIRPGNIVTVQGRGGAINLTIPKVDLRADADADELTGAIPTDHRLQVHVSTRDAPGDPSRSGKTFDDVVAVAADGRFRLSLVGRFDLRASDQVVARVFTPDGHRVVRQVRVPGFDVDLDSGWISCYLAEPAIDVPVTATLRRGGMVVARSAGQSEAFGITLPLHDAFGAPIAPQANDQIDVEIGTPEPTHLSLLIPDLTVVMDWQHERLSGRLSSSGTMELDVYGSQYVYPRPDPDGVFDAPVFRPGATLPWAYPGNSATFRVYLPSGYILNRTFVYPRLSLELGGARVEAMVAPLTPVTVELLDGWGQPIGRGQGRGREVLVGNYDNDMTNSVVVPLTNAQGPVRIQPGQRVRMTAGDATLETTVPELTTTVDWSRRQLQGSGPAGSHFQYARQADRGCRVETGFSWELSSTQRAWTDTGPLLQEAGGRFSFEGFSVAAGKRFMVGYLQPDGHRVYRTIQRPSAIVNLAGGTVEGCSQPLEPVTVELRDEGAAVRAQMQAVAGPDGRYRVTFSDSGETKIPIRPTDTLHVCAIGDCADLPVHFTAVSFEGTTAISGQLTARHTAYLEVAPMYPFTARPDYPQVEGGSMKYWYPYTSMLAPDSDGRFRLTDDTLPPPSSYRPWNITDLGSVRLWFEIDDGHYVVTDAAPRQAIYLPIILVPRRDGQ